MQRKYAHKKNILYSLAISLNVMSILFLNLKKKELKLREISTSGFGE